MATVEIWIPGIMPGMNEIIKAKEQSGKGRRNAYTKLKKDWTRYIADLVRECGLDPVERIHVAFTWREPNRRRDKDNVAVGKKFIFDGMVEAGFIKNDGWGEVEGWTDAFVVDPNSCGVELNITTMEKRK